MQHTIDVLWIIAVLVESVTGSLLQQLYQCRDVVELGLLEDTALVEVLVEDQLAMTEKVENGRKVGWITVN